MAAANRAHEERQASLNEKAAALFHDLSGELREEVRTIYYDEQPVKPQTD